MFYPIYRIAFDSYLKNRNHAFYPVSKIHLTSVIVKNKKLVATGQNINATSKNQPCSSHSEMTAIAKHFRSLGLWKQFQHALHMHYRRTGVFNKTNNQYSFLDASKGKGVLQERIC